MKQKLPVSPVGETAFTGEVKSLRDTAAFREALTYGVTAIQHSLFAASLPKDNAIRLYVNPPVAYTLIAVPFLAFICAVEMVGKAMLTCPISPAFVLGSVEHKRAIESLKMYDYRSDGCAVSITEEEVNVFKIDGAGNQKNWWTPQPLRNKFFCKVINADAHSNVGWFRNIYRIYRRIAELAKRSGCAITVREFAAATIPSAAAAVDAASALNAKPGDFPNELLAPLLLFGQFRVSVITYFIQGRDAKTEELNLVGGVVVNAVASAVVYLARNSLLYVDMGEPNVRVQADAADSPLRAVLVDYDDIQILPIVINDFDTFVAALEANTEAAIHYKPFPALLDAIKLVFGNVSAGATEAEGNSARLRVGLDATTGGGFGVCSVLQLNALPASVGEPCRRQTASYSCACGISLLCEHCARSAHGLPVGASSAAATSSSQSVALAVAGSQPEKQHVLSKIAVAACCQECKASYVMYDCDLCDKCVSLQHGAGGRATAGTATKVAGQKRLAVKRQRILDSSL
jgi:hypothetical protein